MSNVELWSPHAHITAHMCVLSLSLRHITVNSCTLELRVQQSANWQQRLIKAWSRRRASASRLVNTYFQTLTLNSTPVARKLFVQVLFLKLNMIRQKARPLGKGTSGPEICSTQRPRVCRVLPGKRVGFRRLPWKLLVVSASQARVSSTGLST